MSKIKGIDAKFVGYQRNDAPRTADDVATVGFLGSAGTILVKKADGEIFSFSTLLLAVAEAVAGDTIVLNAGSYDVGNNSVVLATDVYFETHGYPTISSDAITGTLTDSGSIISTRIDGELNVINTNGASYKVVVETATVIAGLKFEFLATILYAKSSWTVESFVNEISDNDIVITGFTLNDAFVILSFGGVGEWMPISTNRTALEYFAPNGERIFEYDVPRYVRVYSIGNGQLGLKLTSCVVAGDDMAIDEFDKTFIKIVVDYGLQD